MPAGPGGAESSPVGCRRAKGGTTRHPATHLVGGPGALGGRQWVLPIVDEHDEAGQAAEAEDDLLAGEDGVAGAAGAGWASEAREGGEGARSGHGTPSPGPTHSLASRSLRALRYRCTCAWFTPYSDSIMKTPPTARVQKVYRLKGSGSRLRRGAGGEGHGAGSSLAPRTPRERAAGTASPRPLLGSLSPSQLPCTSPWRDMVCPAPGG